MNPEIREKIRQTTFPSEIKEVPEIKILTRKPYSYSTQRTDEEYGSNPYWSVAWEGGRALARYLLDKPNIASGKRILDFGAGSGIASIAAAKSGARNVMAIDFNPFAREVILLNSELNNIQKISVGEKIDEDQEYDLIIAGDVLYDGRAFDILIPFIRSTRIKTLYGCCFPRRYHIEDRSKLRIKEVRLIETFKMESAMGRLMRGKTQDLIETGIWELN